jgi:thioredoxin family protein
MPSRCLRIVLAFALSGPVTAGAAESGGPRPIELGRVHWGRDVEAGMAAARRTGRPLLLLFQEIPGCATCRNFGTGPLSHPLLVDAIENEFVPVVVYNNRGGADAAVLQRFGEPAMNNPVLRFFARDGKEALPRRDGLWDEPSVARRLVEALRATGRTVPDYLALAAEEVRIATAERATFAMHCFWEGEAALGGLDGVVATRVGYLDGDEAVEVVYLPDVIPYATLVDRAAGLGVASTAFAADERQLAAARGRLGEHARRTDERARDAAEADRKYHLQRSPLRWLPLTPAQAARINADLAAGHDGQRWLSPRQVELAGRIEAVSRRDSGALAGLAPPTSAAEFPAYEEQLLARLNGSAH